MQSATHLAKLWKDSNGISPFAFVLFVSTSRALGFEPRHRGLDSEYAAPPCHKHGSRARQKSIARSLIYVIESQAYLAAGLTELANSLGKNIPKELTESQKAIEQALEMLQIEV